jgi:hypothetical protein
MKAHFDQGHEIYTLYILVANVIMKSESRSMNIGTCK